MSIVNPQGVPVAGNPFTVEDYVIIVSGRCNQCDGDRNGRMRLMLVGTNIAVCPVCQTRHQLTVVDYQLGRVANSIGVASAPPVNRMVDQ